jgi:hypothetical protein
MRKIALLLLCAALGLLLPLWAHPLSGGASSAEHAKRAARSANVNPDCSALFSSSEFTYRPGLPVALHSEKVVAQGEATLEIRTVAFSPDGKYLLVGFGSGRGIRVPSSG